MAAGRRAPPTAPGLEARLGEAEAVVQNQDNREHDVLDSDDYYQFEGGAAAAVATLQGRDRPVYHNDHSRPERPVIRTLDEEVARVVRSRVVNPKWIAGCKRHGYKGAFEIAATVRLPLRLRRHDGSRARPPFRPRGGRGPRRPGHPGPSSPTPTPPPCARSPGASGRPSTRGLWTPRSNSARERIAGLA